MKRSLTATFLIGSGFVAGVTQVLLIRELLVACFGNEIALGLTLAAWLICEAGGAMWGRRWKRGRQSLEHTVSRAIKLAALITPAVFLAIVFVRLYPLLATAVPMKLAEVFADHAKLERLFTVYLAAQPGEMLGPFHLVLISFGAALAPALVIGALFPAGMKAYEQACEGDAAAAGRSYGLDAIGHLIGGVLLGWAAVTLLNPFTVCCVACVVLWVIGWRLLGAVGLRPGAVVWVGTAVIALLLGLSPLFQGRTAGVQWRGQELLETANSLYGHIAVAKHGDEGVVLYQNGSPTGLSPALPSVEQLAQFALLQHPRPRRVLLIGGGATGGLHEVLKHNPDHVDYAEIDPALLRLAERWVRGPDKQALADPRVSKLTTDGRLIVKQAAAGAREKYDVILSMLPDPSTALLNRFYTQEWFQEARAALTPGGVLAWEMSSSRHYFRPSLLLLNSCVFSAFRSAFPQCALMTGDDTVAIAVGDERAHLSDESRVVLQRMTQRGIHAPVFAALARERFLPFNKDYLLSALKDAPPVASNRDLAPVGYFYDQAVWIGYYSPDLEALYVRIGKVRLGDLARPAMILLGALLLLGVFRAGREAYVPLAILATGALGMALELSLLFAFQAYFGYVYQQVGIIIGAFMVGLAAGAILVAGAVERRKAAGRRLPSWLLAAAQFTMGILALALPAVLGLMSGEGGVAPLSPLLANAAFPLLTAIVGLVVGAQFPLATRAAERAREEQGQARSAAGLYAADLIGASVGAVAAGAVLIPVLGISQTCLAAAIVSMGMAVLLVVRAAAVR